MTVHLDWPPEVVDRLIREERQKGLSLDQYLLSAILEKRGFARESAPEQAARGDARNAAGRRIRELQKDNVLSPEVSVRNLIEERRRF